jgi:hypothetical protein
LHNKVLWFRQEQHVLRSYRTGISVHSHTNHSRESLEFIQRICECNVLGQSLLSTQEKIAARRGIHVDLCRAFWIPPLSARAAFDCERRQIEQLGLDPLVSITDHEDIEAPMLLNAIPESCGIPISLEWTVPFLGSTFHIGLHNLPVGRARQICQELLAWTAEPGRCQLRELLHSLHSIPSVLIVLNHPLWNLSQAGSQVFSGVVWQLYSCIRIERTSSLERKHGSNDAGGAMETDRYLLRRSPRD